MLGAVIRTKCPGQQPDVTTSRLKLSPLTPYQPLTFVRTKQCSWFAASSVSRQVKPTHGFA